MFKLVFCLKITLKTENGQFLTADDQVVLQYVCISNMVEPTVQSYAANKG